MLAADAVLAQSSSDETRGAAEEFCGLVRIEGARRAQHRDRQPADRGVADRLGGVAKARPGAKEQTFHWLDEASDQIGSRVRISGAFCPPNPDEIDNTAGTGAARALVGATAHR